MKIFWLILLVVIGSCAGEDIENERSSDRSETRQFSVAEDEIAGPADPIESGDGTGGSHENNDEIAEGADTPIEEAEVEIAVATACRQNGDCGINHYCRRPTPSSTDKVCMEVCGNERDCPRGSTCTDVNPREGVKTCYEVEECAGADFCGYKFDPGDVRENRPAANIAVCCGVDSVCHYSGDGTIGSGSDPVCVEECPFPMVRGNASCDCPEGMVIDKPNTCVPVGGCGDNEKVADDGTCQCVEGYAPAGPDSACIKACSWFSVPSGAVVTNPDGSCACADGYSAREDPWTSIDVKECVLDEPIQADDDNPDPTDEFDEEPIDVGNMNPE